MRHGPWEDNRPSEEHREVTDLKEKQPILAPHQLETNCKQHADPGMSVRDLHVKQTTVDSESNWSDSISRNLGADPVSKQLGFPPEPWTSTCHGGMQIGATYGQPHSDCAYRGHEEA